MQVYHQFIVTATQSGVSSTQFSAPPQIALNLHNTSQVERAILDEYHYHTPGSLYDQTKKSPFWGIMYDGISKFSMNLMGFTFVALMSKTIYLMFHTVYQE